MAKVVLLDLDPAPRTAKLHVDVARAWLRAKDSVVISFTRTGEDRPRIAVVPIERLQEALNRAHAEFGTPGAVLAFPDKLTEPRGAA
jgi:hypothetical protein